MFRVARTARWIRHPKRAQKTVATTVSRQARVISSNTNDRTQVPVSRKSEVNCQK